MILNINDFQQKLKSARRGKHGLDEKRPSTSPLEVKDKTASLPFIETRISLCSRFWLLSALSI